MTFKHNSLGDQVSKKISLWILFLIFGISTAIFVTSYFLSKQMFNHQVKTWDGLIPQYTITSLIDSDSFAIQRDLQFIKSSGLFSTFKILDNQKNVIASFGEKQSSEKLIPIKDEASEIWGYYDYIPDFYTFFSPFLLALALFLIIVFLFYLVSRRRIRIFLETEFNRFNAFLKDIDNVTERLHQIYEQNELKDLPVNSNQKTLTSEQIIINRSVAKLTAEIKKANEALKEAVSQNEKKRYHEELTRTALQVAHDIGSPLAVLEAIVQSQLNDTLEHKIAIKNAALRIRDISNSLLKKAKGNLLNDEQILCESILYLLTVVTNEKRLEFEKIEFNLKLDDAAYTLFSFVRASDFMRVLSNLINNAIEAITTSNVIDITLRSEGSKVLIEIKDYGKGFSKEVLQNIGKLGLTVGKSNGLGMGIYHAIKTLDDYGGEITFHSNEGKTEVVLGLPKSPVPSWFVTVIKSNENQFVIVDDDNYIHNKWRQKFSTLDKDVTIFNFYNPCDFVKWHKEHHAQLNPTYLIDYDLNDLKLNGIELIKNLKINFSSILVTNRQLSQDFLLECETHNIKVIPKILVSYIPIVG